MNDRICKGNICKGNICRDMAEAPRFAAWWYLTVGLGGSPRPTRWTPSVGHASGAVANRMVIPTFLRGRHVRVPYVTSPPRRGTPPVCVRQRRSRAPLVQPTQAPDGAAYPTPADAR